MGTYAKMVFFFLVHHGLPHDLAVKLDEYAAKNPGAIDWHALLMALLKNGLPALITLLQSILGGLTPSPVTPPAA
jgi:hypothetical protein